MIMQLDAEIAVRTMERSRWPQNVATVAIRQLVLLILGVLLVNEDKLVLVKELLNTSQRISLGFPLLL